MAKYVKISVIAQEAMPHPVGVTDPKELLDIMFEYLRKQIDEVLVEKPDLILLPEACDRFEGTPLEVRKEYYRYRGNKIRDFYSEIAKEHNCYIGYSACRYLPEEEKTGKPFRNSTQIIGRDGEVVGIYDKNHLVPFEYDHGDIAYGTDAPVFDLDFGRVCCAICFDLNYDELLYKYAEQKPGLMLFSSMYHGGVTQEKWAITMRSYFVGAIYRDECRILNPIGQQVAHNSKHFSTVTHTINMDYVMVHLDDNYLGNDTPMKLAKKKYGDLVQFTGPEQMGYVMMTYEGDDKTVMDIVEEFNILLLDDYFDVSRKHRAAALKD